MMESEIMILIKRCIESVQRIEQKLERATIGANEYDTAFKLLETDNHYFGDRPCQTCRAISILIKRPFGCMTKQK